MMFNKITGATAMTLLAFTAGATASQGDATLSSSAALSTAEAAEAATALSLSTLATSSSAVTAITASSSAVALDTATSDKVSSSIATTVLSTSVSTGATPASITSSASLQASTAADGQVYVTSTVYKASEVTILSCASTITDCPANSAAQTHTVITTVTVPDYVTVCPVTASLGASKPSETVPYKIVGTTASAPLTTYVSGQQPTTTPAATSRAADSTTTLISTATVIPLQASSDVTTPLATSISLATAGTGAGTGTGSVVSSSLGPFAFPNGTQPTQGPTGTAGAAATSAFTTDALIGSGAATTALASGEGNTDSGRTTTVLRTSYKTVFETIYATSTDAEGQVATDVAAATTEYTTPVVMTYTLDGTQMTSVMQLTSTRTIVSTIHMTSTDHVTVTVPSPSATDATNSGSGSGGQGDESAGSVTSQQVAAAPTGSECQCPMATGIDGANTVTVTMPAQTVYVTLGSMRAPTAAAAVTTANDAAPLASSAAAASLASAPYPLGNSTEILPTGGTAVSTAASTGFLTAVRPSGTGVSAFSVPSVPSSSSSSSSSSLSSSTVNAAAAAQSSYGAEFSSRGGPISVPVETPAVTATATAAGQGYRRLRL